MAEVTNEVDYSSLFKKKKVLQTSVKSSEEVPEEVPVDNSEDLSVVGNVVDVGKGAIYGIVEAAENAISKIPGVNIDITPSFLEPEGTVGKVVADITGFFAAFIATKGRVKKVVKSDWGSSMIAGVAVDSLIWNKNDGNISKVLSDYGVDNIIVDFLKTDPNDTTAVHSFKMALDGALGGVVAESVIKGLVKTYSGLRGVFRSKDPKVVSEAVDQSVKEGKVLPETKPGDVEVVKVEEGNQVVINIERSFNSSDTNIRFPQEFKSPTPRWKGKEIEFESDIENALFIIGKKKLTKADTKYIDWLIEQTGASKDELLDAASKIREDIKLQEAAGEPIKVNRVSIGTKVGQYTQKINSYVALKELPEGESFIPYKLDARYKAPRYVLGVNESKAKPFNKPRLGIKTKGTPNDILESVTSSNIFKQLAKLGTKSRELTEKEADQLLGIFDSKTIRQFAEETNQDFKNLDVRITVLRKATANAIARIEKQLGDVKPDDIEGIFNLLKGDLEELIEVSVASKNFSKEMATGTGAGGIDVKGVPDDLVERLESLKSLVKRAEASDAPLDRFISKSLAKDIHKNLTDLTSGKVTLHKFAGNFNAADGVLTKTLNVLAELRTTSLLSGPVTHGKNIVGNTFVRQTNKVEYMIAGVLGSRRKGFDRLTMEQVQALSSGGFTRAIQSLRVTLGALKHLKVLGGEGFEKRLGKVLLDKRQRLESSTLGAISKEYLLGARDLNTPVMKLVGGVIDTVGSVVRIPYQALAIVDDAFKNVSYGSELASISIREANNLGLKGSAREVYIREFQEAHQKLFNRNGLIQEVSDLSPGDRDLAKKYLEPNKGKFHEEAILKARESVFQEEIRSDSQASAINKTLSLIGEAVKTSIVGKWIIPFYDTPINIMKWVGRRTPGLHLLSQKMTDDIAAGGVRGDLAKAKLVMGTGIYTIGITLALNDDLVGSAPAGEREAWKAAGKLENTIYGVPLNTIEPFGTIFGMIADMQSGYKQLELNNLSNDPIYEDHKMELISTMIVAASSQVLSKTWVESLSQLISAMESEDFLKSGYTEGLAASFIPASTFSRWLQTDDGMPLREAKTYLEYVQKSWTPHLARESLDLFGNPIHSSTFMGVKISDIDEKSPEYRMLEIVADLSKFRKRTSFTPKDSVPIEIELTPKQHWELQKTLSTMHPKRGGAIGIIEDLLNRQWFQELSIGIKSKNFKGTQRAALKNLYEELKKEAKEIYMSKHPEIFLEGAIHNELAAKQMGLNADGLNKIVEEIKRLMEGRQNGK